MAVTRSKSPSPGSGRKATNGNGYHVAEVTTTTKSDLRQRKHGQDGATGDGMVDADVFFPGSAKPVSDAEGARRLGLTDLYFEQRRAMFSHTLPNAPELPAGKEHKKLVGVDGQWYDVTNFVDLHPGGVIIEEYVGRDATDVFWAYHGEEVLAKRRPAGTYELEVADPATVEYRALAKRYLAEGWYETDYGWLTRKVLVCVALFTAVWALVLYPFGGDGDGDDAAAAAAAAASTRRFVRLVVAAPTLAIFWQQCGFFMHDFMHNNTFHNRRIDQWLGTFFGTVCFGISGSWWRDEHNIHHLFTNTYTKEGVFDKQMDEEVWAQSIKLFPFHTDLLKRACIHVQHIIFLPILIFIGRFGIVIDSMLHERRAVEWAALALHYCWVVPLLASLPDWQTRLTFYYIASCVQGVLHIQLLLSHYSKPFVHAEDSKSLGFFRWQILTNRNIDNPWWLDWFHGGLNFHHEHHLFPRMPRHRLSTVSSDLRDICQRHGIHFNSEGWLVAVWNTLVHLKTVGRLVSLDIRH